MTTTYTAKANGQPYTMTVTDTAAPNGAPGVRVTCSCATHDGTSGAAIVATPTAAADFPKKLIHGNITMAHSPAGALAARQGKVWKA